MSKYVVGKECVIATKNLWSSLLYPTLHLLEYKQLLANFICNPNLKCFEDQK